jgi:transposase
MEAYSMDLRQRVAQAVDEGKRTKLEVAVLFKVSPSWIRRLLQRRRETGSLAPKQRQDNSKPKLDESHRQRLTELVRDDPDATLAELCDRVGMKVSVATMCRVLAQLGLSLKKSRYTPANRNGPTFRNNAASSKRN